MIDGVMKVVQIIFTIVAFFIVYKNVSLIKFRITEYGLMWGLVGVTYIIIASKYNNIAPLALYVVPILFMYLKSKKFVASFSSHTVSCLIIIFVDGIVSSLLIAILGKEFVGTKIGIIFVLSVLVFVASCVSKLIFYICNKYKGYILNNYKSNCAIIIYFLLSVIFIMLFITINFNRHKDIIFLTKSNITLFIICGAILILILCVVLLVARKEAQFNYKERELENLKEYTENLEKIYTDMRKFRHDYINIISSIAGFIEDRDIDGLEEHFNNNIYPLNNKINNNNYKLGLLKNIELPEIKGLISSKIIHAQELGIEVGIDIVEPINKIKMDIIDFMRCLGIILDNAVEAAIESENKILNIAFINKNKSILVIVENTFPDELPPVYKMFKYGFSTKGNNRGIGLSNLREISNKYKNVSLETVVKDDKFIQNLTICNE